MYNISLVTISVASYKHTYFIIFFPCPTKATDQIKLDSVEEDPWCWWKPKYQIIRMGEDQIDCTFTLWHYSHYLPNPLTACWKTVQSQESHLCQLSWWSALSPPSFDVILLTVPWDRRNQRHLRLNDWNSVKNTVFLEFGKKYIDKLLCFSKSCYIFKVF